MTALPDELEPTLADLAAIEADLDLDPDFDPERAIILDRLHVGTTIKHVARLHHRRASEIREIGEADGLICRGTRMEDPALQGYTPAPAHTGNLPDADPASERWQDRALCAQTDPEAFFPDQGGPIRPAKRVCRSCEVRAECLAYALTRDERFGVWGGLSEQERLRLRRQAV